MKIKQKAGYKPYSAYQYLERGVDFPDIEWSQWDWAGRHVIELDEAEEARYERIIAENPVVAVHEHVDFCPVDLEPNAFYDSQRQGRDVCGYEPLSYSNLDCVFDNMMDGTCIISSMAGWKSIDIIHDLGMRLCDLAHQDFLIQCKKVDDIFRAKREGKIAWVAVHRGRGLSKTRTTASTSSTAWASASSASPTPRPAPSAPASRKTTTAASPRSATSACTA